MSSDLSAPACNTAWQGRLEQQTRIFTQILFGRKNAADEPVNAIRYDEDGNQWRKKSANAWVTTVKSLENVVRSDARMDEVTEWEYQNDPLPPATANRSHRTGEFERQGVLSSELIPDLTQSIRALRCRLDMVCASVQKSFAQEKTGNDGLFTPFSTPGCAELVTKPVAECQFKNDDPAQQQSIAGFVQNVVTTECPGMANQVFDREITFVDVAFSYDAAERSVLQIGGTIDAFLRGLKGDFLAPVEETLPLLSTFSRLSCFPDRCNE